MHPTSGPIHAYLSGMGRDARGRSASEVIALPDRDLETSHDWVQWLFPLPTRSAAVPGSPVLRPAEIEAIREDVRALDTLQRASSRMIGFYGGTRHWLAPFDHNHLRITRILQSLRLLAGLPAAQHFYASVMRLHEDGGGTVNPESLRYWRKAVAEPDARDPQSH
jgi:hypothetical protein